MRNDISDRIVCQEVRSGARGTGGADARTATCHAAPMRRVRATARFPASVHEAQTLWYDTSGWPQWVEGLEQIVAVDDDWPAAGASVSWQSGPAGRGRVSERVLRYEPLAGQTVSIEDDSIRGRQQVSFSPEGTDVEVELALDYELKRRSPLTALVDLVFIRRAMTVSLEATLERFGARLRR